jgi:Tfp pilus assembly protein FimV
MHNNMQNNFKLKLAVISALSVYALSLPSSAFALGLGSIDVHSHLGQPLRATIKVQGAGELKGDGCFKLIGDSNLENAITNANFKLSKIVNDEAILTVSTSQIISEPITSMAVMAECDANIRRDYTLLLDPPTAVETKNSADEESTLSSDTPQKTNTSAEMMTEKAAPQTVKTHKSASKTAKAKTSSAKKPNKNIVLTTDFKAENVADSKTTAAAEPKALAKTSMPHLSISSGEMVMSNSLESPNLLLDRQLHLSPETSPEAYAPEIAVQDEVTVMNNRLAHLQKQINTLQQRNAALEAANKLKAEQEKTVSNNWQWLSYLAGAGLLAGGYFAANWWRRRRQMQAIDLGDTAWSHIDLDETDAEAPIVVAEATNANDDFFDDNTAKSTLMSAEESAEKQITVEEFDTDQNILDHADVFLSHGRTSLAIQLLQNHLIDHPKQSVTIWLFLLDLLAKENMQAAYEQTTLECKEHFNIRIAEFSNDAASEKTTFEDFPRLHSALQEIWGTPAAVVFLDDLIYNSRLESRVGFEKSVIEELLLLKSIANETINTAEVIQIDEKKLAMKERKEAQIAAKKAEKLVQMNELVLMEQSKVMAADANDETTDYFEFNLVEYN